MSDCVCCAPPWAFTYVERQVSCNCNQPIVFLDEFDSVDPAWTTSPDHPLANFYTMGGFQILEDGGAPPADVTNTDDGWRYITVTRPALNGLQMCVRADCYSRARTDVAGNIRTSSVGVWIGGAVAFTARARFVPGFGTSNIYVRAVADANGDPSGSVTFDGQFGVGGGLTPGDHSILSLSIVDTSSGGGLYTVTFCADGVVIRQETNVALTLTDPINVGIVGTDSAAWEDFVFRSNA